MLQLSTLLALATPAAPQQRGQGGSMGLILGMMIFIGVFFFMTTRSQKKEKNRKKDMLDGLKKNDRVMTIGGVIGTIVNVKDNEVVVKVDEATNTRMTFIRKSIQQVVTGDEQPKLE